MNEQMKKLVELRANLLFAEKRYDEEVNEEKLTELENEITSLKEQIATVEEELNSIEEENSTTEEETQTNEEETQEEANKETQEEQERADEEEVEEEPTSEEVQRSADWVEVNEKNLNKLGSFEQRGGNKMNEETRKTLNEAMTKRAASMKNGETVTVSSAKVLDLDARADAGVLTTDNVALPAHQSSELATVPFKQYSSLVDLVKKRLLNGGESYEAPFAKSYGEGGNTEEGKDYADVEPEFDTVLINKVKITAYAETSEEMEKLPAADYVSEIENCINVAIKKKLAKEIIVGDGTSNHFVGIFSTVEANKCVLATDDLEVAEINGDTLTEIIFNYGGDEELEGTEHLILSKADLLAFSKVRNEVNGMKEYTIDYANQTINGVRYIINSNCTPLANAEVGKYAMAYGNLQAYEMPVFSDIDSRKDYSYKFKQGMIAFRSSLFTGGNTSSYRGFIRVKKGTVSA